MLRHDYQRHPLAFRNRLDGYSENIAKNVKTVNSSCKLYFVDNEHNQFELNASCLLLRNERKLLTSTTNNIFFT